MQFSGAEIIDFVAIGVWIADVAITFAIFAILLSIYFKSETKNKMQLGVCGLYLALGLGRIVFIFFDYIFTLHQLSLYQTYQNIWKLASFFILIGFGFLIIVSEYRLFKGKDLYVFFWGFLIVAILGLIAPYFVWAENLINLAILFALFIPIGYIYLAIKLPGEIRKGIVVALIGIIIFVISLIINKIEIMESFAALISSFIAIPYLINDLYLMAAVLQTIGVVITYFGFKIMYFDNE